MKVISVVNQKGGVGKTTTAVNIATGIAACKKKVLLIDLDPQGNASTGFGISQTQRSRNIYDIFQKKDINPTVIETIVPGLDIITSNINLVGAEFEIAELDKREYFLKHALAQLKKRYDYIFIDCPPSLGLLTINALTASSRVLIPLQCEFYALEGLSHLMKTVKLVQNKLNSDLSIQGILLTMYDRRNNFSSQIEDDVRSCMQDLVLKNVIPRNVRIAEAPSHGEPLLLYDHKCKGSIAYMHVAKEILQKEGDE